MKWAYIILYATLPLFSLDKIILVTGGAQGIGKAIAEKFAEEGKKVVVADIKNGDFSSSIDFFKTDISKEEDVISLLKYVSKKYEGIEGVVHNAAIAIYKNIEDYTLEEWQRIQDVNLKGVFLVSREALPLMKSTRSGWIILIGSIHAQVTSTMNGPYVATKGGIVAFTRALALECAPYGIRVNVISPGAINTPMLMENWGNIPPEKHPLVPRIPLRRLGRPEQIASIAFFLGSEQASYITGSEFLVDGGLSIHFD